MTKSKILIFGAGGVGCTYGMILDKAGAEVTIVCRSNYEAVKANGILIKSAVYGKCHYRPTIVKTVKEATEYGPFDYIIVASKALPGTADIIKDVVTEQTAIVLAQNGILIEERYATLYPANTIISGVVYLPVTQVAPGIIEMDALERFEFGTYHARAPETAKIHSKILAGLWEAGGASAVVHDDVQPARWIKLAVNAAWSPICALTLCDDANYIRSSEISESAVRGIMREVGRLATADGYPNLISDDLIVQRLELPRKRLHTGGKEPSMLTDVRAGRRMEVDAILGNARQIARRYRVETPFLELLYILTKARNYAIAPDGQWKPIARQG